MYFVIDTNVYLHYMMFTDLDWKSLLEAEDLKLYILPTIINELDNEKFNNPNSKIRTRAQEIISKMIKVKRKELKCKDFDIELTVFLYEFHRIEYNIIERLREIDVKVEKGYIDWVKEKQKILKYVVIYCPQIFKFFLIFNIV